MQEPKSPPTRSTDNRTDPMPASDGAVNRLILEAFLPYRLSVLANRVSGTLARAYGERFDLGIPQWRVLAVLGRFPGSSASEIVDRSAMDKVTVSRAVSRLIAKGLIRRQADASDRRRSALTVTTEGEAVYSGRFADQESL